ncbi:MAG: hypothetical protein ACI8RZ_007142 [Myxococcota bacterium]|jgi:hypothetical protein
MSSAQVARARWRRPDPRPDRLAYCTNNRQHSDILSDKPVIPSETETLSLPLLAGDVDATFASTDPQNSFSPTPLQPSDLAPTIGSEVAGRYILTSLLGEGGFGSVWLAKIKGTRQHVALKLVGALSPRALATARREVAALRWAQLPGVVRMLDDGSEGADYFIAMERAEGVPFPGFEGAKPWSMIEATARQLLEILARLHLAGLIHRDLKPANVFVDPLGRPTVIDLGIASGLALRSQTAGYTPAYAAPEQRLGQDCDARTDLYAVGAMLFQALTGRLPHLDPHRWTGESAPPVRVLAPRVPEAVGAVIDRMLSPKIEDRPASAHAVLHALGGQLPLLQGGGGLGLPNTPQTAEDLRSLFHGPDHFLHLREDAADELWARTAGDPEAVEAELGAWLRAGLGHWEDGAVRIDRVAIERLQAGLRLSLTGPVLPEAPDEAALLGLIELAWPSASRDLLDSASPLPSARLDDALTGLLDDGRVWRRADGRLSCRIRIQPAAEWSAEARRDTHSTLAEHSAPADRLRHLIAADADHTTLLDEARRLARQRIEDGALHRVLSPLELGLTLARRLEDAAAEVDLLSLWAKWALAQDAQDPINRALYEIERTAPIPDALEPVHELLKAYQYALDRQGVRALELLERVSPFADERMEIWRVTAMVAATRRLRIGAKEAEAALLEELGGWAALGSEERQGKLYGWQGNLAYRQGRYREAARLHQQAAGLKRERFAQVSSMLNSASALLEALDFEAARLQATQTAQAARAIRHVQFEALATWLARSSDYRLGNYTCPDLNIVEAASSISTYTHGLFAMGEASQAWRCGDLTLTRALARAAHNAFPQRPQKLLLRALELAAGASAEPEELDELFTAQANLTPDFSVQIIALLRCVDDRPIWRTAAQHIAMNLPQEAHELCLDLLSVSECIHPHPPGSLP